MDGFENDENFRSTIYKEIGYDDDILSAVDKIMTAEDKKSDEKETSYNIQEEYPEEDYAEEKKMVHSAEDYTDTLKDFLEKNSLVLYKTEKGYVLCGAESGKKISDVADEKELFSALDETGAETELLDKIKGCFENLDYETMSDVLSVLDTEKETLEPYPDTVEEWGELINEIDGKMDVADIITQENKDAFNMFYTVEMGDDFSVDLKSVSVELDEKEMKRREIQREKQELTEGIISTFNGEAFKNYLNMRKTADYIHKYSRHNSLLIFAQSEGRASTVMGFEKWKEYGRCVAKGAKSLKILMPKMAGMKEFEIADKYVRDGGVNWLGGCYYLKKDGDRYSIISNTRKYYEGDREGAREYFKANILGKAVTSFRVGSVFDISMTEKAEYVWVSESKVKDGTFKKEEIAVENGKEVRAGGRVKIKVSPERSEMLKEPEKIDFGMKEGKTELSAKEVKNLLNALKSVSEKNGVRVSESKRNEDGELLAGADGYFAKPKKESGGNKGNIIISEDMSDVRKCGVLAHEMAHSILHGVGTQKMPSKVMELEAEATSYIVMRDYGIDASTNSFEYISAWLRSENGLSSLEKSIERIVNTADMIKDGLEKEMTKEKTLMEHNG